MDDDCLPADDDNAPRKDGNARRSVAGTLGQRRFQRAPGPLSLDETQQLDQSVAAGALDNVLGLLQRKTREAYVIPWYKQVKRGWTYMHDGELCELHAVEYAKGKDPRLMVRLLERNTVAPKIIELHESDVSKLTVFKRPKPTETHTKYPVTKMLAHMLAWAVDAADFRLSRNGDGAVPAAAHGLRACGRAMARRRGPFADLGVSGH